MAAAKKKKEDEKPPTAQAGNYAAPVDTVGMDEEMKASLGLGPKGREVRPTGGRETPMNSKIDVGIPGSRPPVTNKNLAAMKEEIARMHDINSGLRIMRRREGALRNPRNGQ